MTGCSCILSSCIHFTFPFKSNSTGLSYLCVKQGSGLTKSTWIRVPIVIGLALISLRAPVTEGQEEYKKVREEMNRGRKRKAHIGDPYCVSSMVARLEKVQAVFSFTSVGISFLSSQPKKKREKRMGGKSNFCRSLEGKRHFSLRFSTTHTH